MVRRILALSESDVIEAVMGGMDVLVGIGVSVSVGGITVGEGVIVAIGVTVLVGAGGIIVGAPVQPTKMKTKLQRISAFAKCDFMNDLLFVVLRIVLFRLFVRFFHPC